MKLIEILENRKEALKVAEVAKMLGVTPQHIYKMAKAGLIPCFHVRGQSVFAPQTLQNGSSKRSTNRPESVMALMGETV
jgi:predicted site-specific integrase-resolvase